MNQINTYFLIGTIGMLITSILHILMAAITSEEAVAASGFWIMYPVFAGFLISGTLIMMNRKESLKE